MPRSAGFSNLQPVVGTTHWNRLWHRLLSRLGLSPKPGRAGKAGTSKEEEESPGKSTDHRRLEPCRLAGWHAEAEQDTDAQGRQAQKEGSYIRNAKKLNTQQITVQAITANHSNPYRNSFQLRSPTGFSTTIGASPPILRSLDWLCFATEGAAARPRL